MSSYSQAQFPTWAYNGVPAHYGSYSQVNNYPAYLAESMNAYQAHHSRLLNQQMGRTNDSKPRLSKEEVEVLEAEFQKNHKPSSATKKTLAESMRVDTARINNWFQNRRAREKKERNIREYEAKQKLEKEQAEANGIHVTDDRKKDLVASSAPFPQPRKADESTSTSPVSPIDNTSEISDAAKSEANSVETTPDLLCDTAFKSDRQGEDSSDHSPMDVPDYLSVSDGSGDLPFSDPEVYLANDRSPSQIFSEYQSMMAQNSVVKPNDYFSSSLFIGNQDQLDSLSPSGRFDSKLKSPPCLDVAMRRNRRPTPLSINGARAFTQMGPRTAMDLSRVVDNTSFMRRTSSSSSRVTKNIATPRNLFTLNRTPSSSGHSSTTTPPTPDTPLAVNTMNAFALDKSMMGAYSNQDLTTPPATPGGVEGLFNGYTMSMGEEGLAGMGMANNFAMGAGSAYGAASRSTIYAPQMNATYYNMYSGGSEYHSE